MKQFPQDSGSGLQDQNNHDYGDAAHLGALAHSGPQGILTGCDIVSTDFTVPNVTVGGGEVRIVDTSVDARDHSGDGTADTTWPEVVQAYRIEQTTVTLTDAAVNELYVQGDQSSPDNASVVATSDGLAPSGPTIKIGEVDTSANSVSEQFNKIEDDGTLSFPDADSANAALSRLPTGVAVVDRANGVRLTSADVSAEGVETDASVKVTDGEATDTLHYGSNQDRANAGDQSVALGIGARANGDDGAGGTINSHTVVGYQAARDNTGDRVTASGYQAAQSNTGDRVTASGYQATRGNTGFGVTASGFQAARGNTGNDVTASGFKAARDNTGNRVTASGAFAAQDNTGDRVTASGYQAAQSNTGDRVTASGFDAARNNTGNRVTASGFRAALNNTGFGVTASGYEAARDNTGNGVIALGYQAANNNSTNDLFIVTDQNGNRRMEMDLTNGDLKIDGSLTQNASL